MSLFLADPDSILNWSHDWSAWLASGDSISSRQWAISPTGPTLTNDTSATVTIEGLTAGNVYKLSEHVVSANGIEADRSITIRCAER